MIPAFIGCIDQLYALINTAFQVSFLFLLCITLRQGELRLRKRGCPGVTLR